MFVLFKQRLIESNQSFPTTSFDSISASLKKRRSKGSLHKIKFSNTGRPRKIENLFTRLVYGRLSVGVDFPGRLPG